ncbi:MAG TPA: NDP-sugar synthase [Actinomycetota bacterium]|nr:NDP-sugar synthase [Actinomycetota bacterium]
MKAVVLVGGEGTRLRPITETMPKPLVPLMDRPSLDHVLDHLASHGVHEVVLSSSYLEATFHAFIQARHGDPAITWITETEPLGTGGAIVSALHALDTREAFLALNGDILTDLDLTAMMALHRDREAAATIALHHVEDARPYGLVPMDADGRVLEFREKPDELVPGDINAGTYVLEPDALEGWEPGRTLSIEREIFPALIRQGRPLYGFVSDAYWMDLGTPEKYLRAHVDLLDGRVKGHPAYAAPFVAPGGSVDEDAVLGPHVVAGPGVRIGSGAEVQASVLHELVEVGEGSVVHGSILGPRVVIGRGARVTDSVLGDGARVEAGVTLHATKVAPGERVHSP